MEDLPVPASVIGGDDFLNQGTTDLVDQLARLVPSYNVNQQPINDAATFIRPANLRSLPPDATLCWSMASVAIGCHPLLFRHRRDRRDLGDRDNTDAIIVDDGAYVLEIRHWRERWRKR